MGKIATKCCRPCEAGNEVGNANLEQPNPIIENNKPEFDHNKSLLLNEEETKINSAKTKFNSEINSFIEKHKCNFSLKNFSYLEILFKTK